VRWFVFPCTEVRTDNAVAALNPSAQNVPPTGSIRDSRSLPLERKLPLLNLGLFALVLAGSLSASYYEIRHSAELSAAERLSALSQVLSSLLEQQTNARLTLMRRLAHDSSVQNALRAPDREPSEKVEKTLSTLITAQADTATPPQLWRPDGRPVGHIKLDIPADVHHLLDEVRQQGPTDSGRVGRLYATNGRASFWVAVPVRQDGGNLLGFIAQERRINSSPRALQPIRDLIGSDIDFYFRDTTDNIWVMLTGQSVPPPTKVRPFLDSLSINAHGAKGDLLASTAKLRGTPFLLTVERPMAMILGRPAAMIRVLMAIGVLLAVIGAAIAWLISRQLVRPLGELTAAAEAMAHGEYSRRVSVDGTDEVARLGASFNRMAEQVQDASDESALAVERLTQSVQTEEFLAEASRILAGSLSDDTLISDLARCCVPRLADYCTIHVLDDDGAIRRIETVHYDPAKQNAVRALVRQYEYRVDGPGEVAAVVRTQEPVIVPRLDFASIRGVARTEAIAKLLDEVHPTSFMCVPLVARGRSFGAMSFTMTDSGRTFSHDDLELANEVARRTAVAIDNALIYRRSLALRLEAEAASNAKSDFLAKMSHEIRTPINAMMGYAELLEMKIAGPITDMQAKQLRRIRASGEHLTSLVNEILDLAKIESGRMGVEPTIGIAGDAADAALNLIRPQATTKGIDLVTKAFGDPQAEYLGDPQRVQQIITNLLSNAVKFTPPGGSVSIRCGTAPSAPLASTNGTTSWTCITVQDSGKGIAADDLERIFHPFVQVDVGYTRSHGGTGLGLTISRNLAQMMGGDISVESVSGEGSRFTLWLPSPDSCNPGE
jgi:signal transduction histidine kinase